MRIEKDIKKAIEATNLEPDKTQKEWISDCIEWNNKKLLPVREFKELVCKYMSFDEYMKQDIAFGVNIRKFQRHVFTATSAQDKIVDYKIKMAMKHGKALKNDPRTRAFIDISDCLTRYLDDKNEIRICSNKYGYNREELTIHYEYDGKICLPFNNCFVYTRFQQELAHIMEIKDNEDGTYSGTFWAFLRLEKVLQMSFKIEREDNHWLIKIDIILKQKPLGQTLTNLGVIFNYLSTLNKEECKPDSKATQRKLECYNDWVGVMFSNFSAGIIPMLSYLSSYKSKVVYKLTNEDKHSYVYSDKVGEGLNNYLTENYPDFKPEKINGWLVGGNWNFLNPKEYGKNKNGKSIKGLDWNDPYKNHKEEQVVESNEQKTRLIPIHALERAKQRYNLDLSSEDLQNIADECLKGHAVKLSVRDKFGKLNTAKGKKSCYRVNYKNNFLDVVLSDSQDSNSYRIATFLPKPSDIKFNVIDSKDYNEVMKDVMD